MARTGMPSLLALLGLVAVAGYQNRGRLAEALRPAGDQGVGRPFGGAGDGVPDRHDRGFLDELADMFGGPGKGQSVRDGLDSLLERFRTAGRGDEAESWVARGPNRPVAPQDIEAVVGRSTVDDLARRTGLDRDELLSRLASVLPDAVDRMTPEGRFPTADEAGRLI